MDPERDDEGRELDAKRAPRRPTRVRIGVEGQGQAPRLFSRSQPPPAKLPRYVRVEGGRERVWQILRRGATLTTWFGSADRAPRSVTRSFADAARAKRALRALVSLKQAQGYELAPPLREARPDPDTSCRSLDLEQAIARAPDDLHAYGVYADWLQARGDARGELIAVQLARHEDPRSEVLATVEADLIGRLSRDVLGVIGAPLEPDGLTWRHGFVAEAKLTTPWPRAELRAPLGELTRRLLSHPCGALLRKLTLASSRPLTEPSSIAHALEVLARQAPPTLVALHLSEDRAPLGDVSDSFACLPRLRELTLSGSQPRFRGPAGASLGSLTLHNVDLDREAVEQLASSRFPRLTSLRYRRTWLGGSFVDGLTEQLSSASFPMLRSLAIGATYLRYGESAIDCVLSTPLLAVLERVDLDVPLSNGDVTKLIDHAPALRHLKLRLRDGNEVDPLLKDALELELPRLSWSVFDTDPF